MKLFVLCIGALVVASGVAAIEDDQEMDQFGGVDDTYCGIGDHWFMRKKGCDPDADPAGPSGCEPQYDNPLYETDGICCGCVASSSRSDEDKLFCAAVELARCFDKDDNCCKCYYKEKPTPPPFVQGCCPNNCCEAVKPLSADVLFTNDGPFADIADAEETADAAGHFEAYKVLDGSSEIDVFISHEVHWCGESYPMRIISESIGDGNFTCVELCCECCRNLDVAVTDPEKTMSVTTGSGCNPQDFVEQYAQPSQTYNFKGPASLCMSEDSFALYTHDLGLVSVSNSSSLHNYRVAIGCPKKQDGGNPGFFKPQNLNDTTL